MSPKKERVGKKIKKINKKRKEIGWGRKSEKGKQG